VSIRSGSLGQLLCEILACELCTACGTFATARPNGPCSVAVRRWLPWRALDWEFEFSDFSRPVQGQLPIASFKSDTSEAAQFLVSGRGLLAWLAILAAGHPVVALAGRIC